MTTNPQLTNADEELRKSIEEIIITDSYSHGIQLRTIDKMGQLITTHTNKQQLEMLDRIENDLPKRQKQLDMNAKVCQDGIISHNRCLKDVKLVIQAERKRLRGES